jgi:hypothetical protein
MSDLKQVEAWVGDQLLDILGVCSADSMCWQQLSEMSRLVHMAVASRYCL